MTQLTVLTANPRKPLTKTIFMKAVASGPDEVVIQGYDQYIKYFSSRTVPISNFATMAEALNKLQGDIYSCVIRGVVADNVDVANHPRTKRGASPDGTIVDTDQQWAGIDIDNFNISAFGVTDPLEAIAHIKGMLPTCFAKANCWWKFSSSMGFKDDPMVVSLHMYFWLSESASNTELKSYFETYNESIKEMYGIERLVDTVFFDPIQIHYTASPHLVGIDDPLKVRYGVHEGETEAVLLAEDFIPAGSMATQEGAVQKYLNSMGDDKDGIHGPILSASMVYVRLYGSTDNAKTSFKALVREKLGTCDTSKHTGQQMERYRSDQYLDQLLRTADIKIQSTTGKSVSPPAFMELSKYILFTETHRYYNEETQTDMSKDLFNDLTARFFGGKRAGAVAFTADDRFRKAAYTAMVPGKPSLSIVKLNGTPVYNTWRGRVGVFKPDWNVDPMSEHIEFLCDGRMAEAEQLLDFMAFIISKPGDKVIWAPIISGPEGTGKSTIKQILRKVYSPQHVAEIGVTELDSAFNPYATSELLFIEEAFNTDRNVVAAQLRKLISDPMIDLNIKFMRQRQTPNYLNILVFTNDRNPLHMDQSDRRYLFIRSEHKPLPESYYRELYGWISTCTDDLFSWAVSRDLSKFNPSAPPIVTAAKLRSIRASIPAAEQFLRDSLQQKMWPFQHDVVYAGALAAALQSHPLFKTMKLSTFQQFMENIGLTPVTINDRILYKVRPTEEQDLVKAANVIIGHYSNYFDLGSAF